MGLPTDQDSRLEVVPLIIDGKEKAIDPSRVFEVRSSISDELVSLAHGAAKQDALDAADAAWEFFHTWKRAPGSRRREIFLRAADLIRGTHNYWYS